MINTDDLTDLDAEALARRTAEDAEAARLAAERLAVAQAEQGRRAAEHAAQLAAVRREWDTALVKRHLDLEAFLRDVATKADDKFDAAIAAGDLGEAVRLYIRQRSTRTAIQYVRDAARSAEANAKTGIPISDVIVRWFPIDLVARIEASVDKAASALGADAAERLIGERPDDLEVGS